MRYAQIEGHGLAWIAALLVMAFAPLSAAQSTITAEAAFRQEVCYLGDEVQLQIAVENSDRVDAPDLSGIPGATFAFAGTSNESRTMVSIVNGRRREEATKRLVMRWVVTPMELGTLIVPPMLVQVDGGQVVETGEVRLRVIEPERELRDVIVVTPEAESVYVNQPVRVSVSWILTADIETYSFRASKADTSLLVQPLQKPRRGNEPRYEVKMLGGTALASLGYATLDGKRERAMQFDLLVTPTEAGDMSFGPIVVSYDERVSRVSSRRVIAQSDPIVFRVREMPTEGRPANFSGLLGTHGIEVRAEPTSVSVGDPIGLEVTIYGPEPMPGVRDGPDLSLIPGFADGFRLAGEGWTSRPGGKPGERRFTTTVRVADPSVAEIPAIPLPFFDPGEGEYRIAASDPIPLTVRAVREITAADAVVSSSVPAAVSRDPLTGTAPGVWALDRGAAVLATGDPLSGAPWAHPGVLAIAVIPPGVFAVVGVLAVRRRTDRDAAALRRSRALRNARATLEQEGAAPAIRRYLADAFDASPEAMTGADGDRLLRESGVDDPGPVVELITAHEAALYGSGERGPERADADRRRVASLLAQIDRQIDGQISRPRSTKGASA